MTDEPQGTTVGELLERIRIQFQQGNLSGAEVLVREILELQPGHALANSLLGIIAGDKGDYEAAVKHITVAIRNSPNDPTYHYNLGLVMHKAGHAEKALEAFREAIRLQPDYPDARKNYGMVLLMTGDFRQGWREYEWRWQDGGFLASRHGIQLGYEDAGPVHGETFLLNAERGFGDTLQFIRYVPLVRQAGYKVILECRQPLMRLFSTLPGVDGFVETGSALPHHDVQVPLMSLPYLLGTTLDTVPDVLPGLYVPELPADVCNSAGFSDREKNIGIVWAGNPKHNNDSNRSAELSHFRSLPGIQGIKLFSLQVGERVADLGKEEGFEDVVDLSPYIEDYADTAAMISRLDLVISVDTSIVHLAGTLGRPVWVLLPSVPDWRWLLDREDSPWYQSVRLFRQKKPGDWDSVFEKVAEELQQLNIEVP